MSDWILGGAWCSGLLFAFAATALLHRAGLPRTYARDLLHVGAGVWVVGWPWWSGPLVPLIIVWAALAATAALPLASPWIAPLRRVKDSLAGEGERWSGIVAYAGSFAALTTLALGFHLLPPAGLAAAALCAGDGLGGLIGRRFGRHRYAVPWSKAKTWEGTAAVAAFSVLGMVLMARFLAFPLPWAPLFGLGAVSAAAEALAPRASDNVVVPAAVFAASMIML